MKECKRVTHPFIELCITDRVQCTYALSNKKDIMRDSLKSTRRLDPGSWHYSKEEPGVAMELNHLT